MLPRRRGADKDEAARLSKAGLYGLWSSGRLSGGSGSGREGASVMETMEIRKKRRICLVVAVYSENPNVDPIGACIGEKGSRIARIINELGGEKIDVVRYDKDPAVFIANSLSPAKNLTVIITDPKKQEAMVIADDDNFSLAIGKRGQNARLASRLTHYKIDIKTREQASENGINIRTEE